MGNFNIIFHLSANSLFAKKYFWQEKLIDSYGLNHWNYHRFAWYSWNRVRFTLLSIQLDSCFGLVGPLQQPVIDSNVECGPSSKPRIPSEYNRNWNTRLECGNASWPPTEGYRERKNQFLWSREGTDFNCSPSLGRSWSHYLSTYSKWEIDSQCTYMYSIRMYIISYKVYMT